MALKIEWTKRASLQFDHIKAWMGDTGSIENPSVFVKQVFEIVDLLSVYPELGMLEDKERKIRGILVSRYHRLFYRLSLNQLTVIAIFDQRMDHRKGKLL